MVLNIGRYQYIFVYIESDLRYPIHDVVVVYAISLELPIKKPAMADFYTISNGRLIAVLILIFTPTNSQICVSVMGNPFQSQHYFFSTRPAITSH